MKTGVTRDLIRLAAVVAAITAGLWLLAGCTSSGHLNLGPDPEYIPAPKWKTGAAYVADTLKRHIADSTAVARGEAQWANWTASDLYARSFYRQQQYLLWLYGYSTPLQPVTTYLLTPTLAPDALLLGVPPVDTSPKAPTP